jgi:Tfp pilus assembly protein PilN
MLVQGPPPIPNPPSIPIDPNLIASTLDSPAIVMIVLLVMTACTIVLWPLVRALARRLEGRGGQDAALRGEVEHLQQRLGEVDQLQIRIADLEERLDFTERMLAQSREPDRLQR